jgi:hypothetical protein
MLASTARMEHSPIESELTVDTTGWTPGMSSVTFQIRDAQGNVRGSGTVTLAEPGRTHPAGPWRPAGTRSS